MWMILVSWLSCDMVPNVGSFCLFFYFLFLVGGDGGHCCPLRSGCFLLLPSRQGRKQWRRTFTSLKIEPGCDTSLALMFYEEIVTLPYQDERRVGCIVPVPINRWPPWPGPAICQVQLSTSNTMPFAVATLWDF